MKKIFLFIFLMFIFVLNVNAEACDAYDIKRLKEIAEGVEITYERQEPFYNGETVINDYYTIKVSGLTSDIFVYDKDNDEYYTVNNSVREFVNSGYKQFLVKANVCSNVLGKVNLKLPVYNRYYGSFYCEGNEKLSVCQEWVEYEVNDSEIKNAISFNKNVEEMNFFEKYFYYILIILVFILFIIVYLVIKKKREVLV